MKIICLVSVSFKNETMIGGVELVRCCGGSRFRLRLEGIICKVNTSTFKSVRTRKGVLMSDEIHT